MTKPNNTASGAADQPDALIERLEDAVYEWGNYVDEDHAPRPLTRHVDPHIKAIAAELQRLRAALAAASALPAQQPNTAYAALDVDIDAIALARYKVTPSHESMFHRFAVVAGDGEQQLYLGRETECRNVARKFAGAFLDGAFYQAHASQQAPSVPEDAARYRFLRDSTMIAGAINEEMYVCVDSCAHPGRWALTGAELDEAVDAAIHALRMGGKP